MKRLVTFLLIAVACCGAAWSVFQTANPILPEKPLSQYVPAGPLLYIEAKDFSSLLGQWNASLEKQQWSASTSYHVFSESRLFLRLKGAGDQFAAAGGLPPDMKFLSEVAGDHSALALYDIGKLQFLYITHLPSAKSMQTALWQTRAKFELRNVAGTAFYIRRDPESQREVAFAVSGDYLLLATREDLLAGALQLMAGGQQRTVESEEWWSKATGNAKEAGDLRMVLNLEKIVPDGYFRTYWVQQNITDLSHYSAAISDLFLSGREYREERTLIRKADVDSGPPSESLTATAEVVRLVPSGTGSYVATATPSAATCFDLLKTKLLDPRLGTAPPSENAPQVQLTSGEVGGTDLETRIDQPVATRAEVKGKSALENLLERTRARAALQVQSTARDIAGVFVHTRSAVVLVSDGDWNQVEVQAAIAGYVRPELTASGLGVSWQQKPGYLELDGLWPLIVSVHRNYLIVADDAPMAEAMLANLERKTDQQPAEFIAGFNHERECENFARFASVVDRPNMKTEPDLQPEPQFFSGTIAGLSGSLSAVSGESIVVRGDKGKVRQTVIYQWSH